MGTDQPKKVMTYISRILHHNTTCWRIVFWSSSSTLSSHSNEGMSAFNSGRTCRMACIVRLLEDENLPEISPDEETDRENVIQSIHRQILDANEPNLLDEEDMDVFGSSPLTDPLYLVQCKVCKKNIKSSHITAHTDRCTSINACKGVALDLDAATHTKKTPNKKRKPQATNGRMKEKSDPADDNVAGSLGFKIENQNGTLHASSVESASPQASVDHGKIPIATKACQKRAKYTEMSGPLATKIYYTKGSYRLRTMLGHLYHQSNLKDIGNGSSA